MSMLGRALARLAHRSKATVCPICGRAWRVSFWQIRGYRMTPCPTDGRKQTIN